MSRRIEIELTSARPDGTWTWRVTGARQPKGTLDGGLLPAGAKVGDTLRAEAEFELDGTVITGVLAPQGKRAEPERLQLLGDTKPFEGVTTSLVPKGARPRRDRDERGPRGDREGRGRPDRRGPRDDREGRDARGARPDARPDRRERERPRPAGDRPPERGGEADATTRRQGGPGRRPDTPRRPEGGGRARQHPQPPGGPRSKRLTPGSTHRNAVLDSLAPEERAVAEQVLQGGIPAVRRALQEQNAKAREEGRPEVKADALIALAEELLPRVKGAEWRDRAEAAAKEGDELSLRDLRSVVAGADAGARDDESRILAKSLRDALERREAAERDAWLKEIDTHLEEGRVTRALRLAGRPPDPRTRFPQELLDRLAAKASEAMSPEVAPDRWALVLAAVLESPVRRSVKPAGLPPQPGDALLAAARQASGRIPALAGLLGLEMPPPPGPRRPPPRPPAPPAPPPAPPGPPAAAAPPAPPAG